MQKTNPYIFGATVSGKNFYGDERRRLIAEISAADNPVHAYAVFGLRRYGKSSFLKELAGTIAAQAPDDLCVSWNLAGCDAPDKALEALCSGLVDDKCEIKPVQV